MKYLYIDIEVIPNLDESQKKEVRDSIHAPGNYKKEESIAKWQADEGETQYQEKLKKACFNELTGKIIAIGYAFGDTPVAIIKGEEKAILAKFAAMLFKVADAENGRMPVLTAYNGIAFDIPYIWRRCKIHNISLPFGFPTPPDMKPWMNSVEDPMIMWAGTRDRIKMDTLAEGLGFKSHKSEMDGSMVWEAYKDGEMDRIYDYCMTDVSLLRKIHNRLR